MPPADKNEQKQKAAQKRAQALRANLLRRKKQAKMPKDTPEKQSGKNEHEHD